MILNYSYHFFSKASIPFIGALLFLGVFTACQPYEETAQKQTKGALEDSLFRFTESSDVDVSMMEKGNRFLSIRSPFAKSYQSNGNNFTTFSGGVSIQLFDSLQMIQSQVICSTATYNTVTNIFDFVGDVRVTSTENRKLFTEKLLWFREDRHIETMAFVSIFTEKDTLYGYGLHGDESLENYEITKVSGKITLD
ncbi:hypothetical protein EP331_02645 [bacterium]|nr:MAG: hypothetical protein EP331_02645 [bacterium]